MEKTSIDAIDETTGALKTGETLVLHPYMNQTTYTTHPISCVELGTSGRYVSDAGTYPAAGYTNLIVIANDGELPKMDYRIHDGSGYVGFVPFAINKNGYSVVGNATTGTVPSEADGNVYRCRGAGTYTNFTDLQDNPLVCADGDGMLCVQIAAANYCWFLIEGSFMATKTY